MSFAMSFASTPSVSNRASATSATLLALTLGAASPAIAQRSAYTARISVSSPMQNVDTHMDPHVTSRFFSKAVFDNFVGLDPIRKKYTSLLAKSWKRIDPKTMEYSLREDVKWHDGEAFDADDVGLYDQLDARSENAVPFQVLV